MRFDGSRVIEAPVAAVWYALRNPDTLEMLIPRCARIERQPGYRPETNHDFTISFESAAPAHSPGAGAVIGWLEVDRQRPPHHLALTLTLNDALTFMHIDGTIDLAARNQGRATELRYAVDAKVPGLRGVGWSSNAHEETERLITSMLNELARLLGTTMEASLGYANGYVAPTDQPQVLLETQRGSV
ncbi:MAG: SRPBCC family protein, partial [Ktedonobacterales bacterium]|nr:SRPBCC family protein [Ktedonobacterales bacterium]